MQKPLPFFLLSLIFSVRLQVGASVCVLGAEDTKDLVGGFRYVPLPPLLPSPFLIDKALGRGGGARGGPWRSRISRFQLRHVAKFRFSPPPFFLGTPTSLRMIEE